MQKRYRRLLLGLARRACCAMPLRVADWPFRSARPTPLRVLCVVGARITTKTTNRVSSRKQITPDHYGLDKTRRLCPILRVLSRFDKMKMRPEELAQMRKRRAITAPRAHFRTVTHRRAGEGSLRPCPVQVAAAQIWPHNFPRGPAIKFWWCPIFRPQLLSFFSSHHPSETPNKNPSRTSPSRCSSKSPSPSLASCA